MVWFFGLVFFGDISFMVSLFLTMSLAACSASLAPIPTSIFAWPFSICPADNKSKILGLNWSSLSEFAIVLLALPVAVATSSWVKPNSLLSLS